VVGAAFFVLAASLALPALGQSNAFRASRSHLGVAVGLHTYHGPADLINYTDDVDHSEAALVLLGSFPLTRENFFFRAMIGYTNFFTEDAERALGANVNPFLTEGLLWVEPELVYAFEPGANARWLLYGFTGFGWHLAAPFQENDVRNVTGAGIIGPERSTFSLPVGLGVDYALNPHVSFFVEGSYRFHLNYVVENERQRRPFDTSLIMAGLRFAVQNPFARERVVRVADEPLIPPRTDIPIYVPPVRPLPPLPPRPEVVATPMRCQTLVELNTVFFAFNSVQLDARARDLLDQNVEALLLDPQCHVEIVGFTDRDDASGRLALRLSRQRADAVYDYYQRSGIAPERMIVRAEGLGIPCDKDDEGIGCLRKRRVESNPFDPALTPGGVRQDVQRVPSGMGGGMMRRN
jgi:outer membrane protein OmpA-like peptidoglycan-associated protein